MPHNKKRRGEAPPPEILRLHIAWRELEMTINACRAENKLQQPKLLDAIDKVKRRLRQLERLVDPPPTQEKKNAEGQQEEG